MQNLPPPEMAAYFLDFDGTLVDIAPAPHLIRVETRLAQNLRRLRGICGNAVAIVTGRPLAQVDEYLPGAAFAVAAEHGTAIRLSPGADVTSTVAHDIRREWVVAAGQLAAAHPGAMLEAKRHGFALHYRAAPDAGKALHEALRTLIAQEPDAYELMEAKMAWEVRPKGIDKGSAVRKLMEHAPFAGRLPIFVGDDVTDEDGMRAARQLGGVGLRVDETFGDPAGVRAWLAGLIENGSVSTAPA